MDGKLNLSMSWGGLKIPNIINKYTVEIGDKELFGHPKIVP